MSLACLGLVVECQGGALNSYTARNAKKEPEHEKEAPSSLSTKTETSEVEVSGRTSKARKTQLCGQVCRRWHEREVRKERRVGKVSKCARYRKGSVES